MELMCKDTIAVLRTPQTMTTTRLPATTIHTQARQEPEQRIILPEPTTMVVAIPSIQVHVEDSITSIATATRHTFLNAADNKECNYV